MILRLCECLCCVPYVVLYMLFPCTSICNVLMGYACNRFYPPSAARHAVCIPLSSHYWQSVSGCCVSNTDSKLPPSGIGKHLVCCCWLVICLFLCGPCWDWLLRQPIKFISPTLSAFACTAASLLPLRFLSTVNMSLVQLYLYMSAAERALGGCSDSKEGQWQACHV